MDDSRDRSGPRESEWSERAAVGGISRRFQWTPGNLSKKNLNDVQPPQKCSAQIARAKVIISAELLTEVIGAEQRDLGISLQFETTPNEPKIEIETTWRIDQCAHNVQIRRNRMLADFIPELLA
jgi:hypothetical protein